MAGNHEEGTTSETTSNNIDIQKTEIESVKQAVTGQCKIIENLGDYTHVVTLQPTNGNIIYKFQLKKSYPNSLPNVIIRSPAMKDKEIDELQLHLVAAAGRKLGSPMMMSLINEVDEWIKEHEIDMTKTLSKNQEKHVNKQKPRADKGKHRQRKQKIEEKETENEKKPSMKTADDVINRILWDGELERDQFLVGYIDRFTGLQEKYFTAFSWEDIASVDYNVLAVPKHRIQYFKYKDIKVWDKNQRLDNVFGSLGSNTTLYDVINNYEKNNLSENQNENNDTETANNADDASSDTDSDSDDDIVVTIDSSASKMEDQDEADLSDDEGFDKYWRDKMRATHFLALRITSEDIKSMANHIQDSIVEHEPHYEECCIPSSSLHVTLCTLGLDTPEQVANAVQVVQKIKPELENILSSATKLKFRNIQNFFNRVLYAEADCPPEFMKMVDHLRLCLRESGIEIRDSHDFVPHMTIMKVSRPVAKATGKKYIAPWLYSNQSNIEFGTQVVNNIHLCEMGISRREDGFYMTPVSLELNT